MSYSVTNIIPINVLLTPSGLSFANFSTCFAFGVDADLETPGSIAADTYKDYATLDEVAEDFTSSSPPYLMASRWFANVPRPTQFSVWIWDDSADSPAEVAAKANNEAWRYWYFFPASVFDKGDANYAEADVTALMDWADANAHMVPFTITDPLAVDPGDSTDLLSVIQTKGTRHTFGGYRQASTISSDASQIYAHVQTAAAFNKFDPDGLRTAITAEYQVLPGVVGESLTTTEYNALKDKNGVFWTQVELQGSIDQSRVINSKSMSSFNEFIDDVVNLDVLRNRIQVDGYNYIANAGTKRPLTPRGFAGLLSRLSDTFKVFYDNGVLGEAEYTDPATGETEIAKYGFVIFSDPEDVFELTNTQRQNREFPSVDALAILSRAGHTATINVTVQ